ncbi:cupin-like domain-containing protein [Duganella sp. FT80W]|uniref:Cupin-like domain-containing protein n=1 Tax=Duganella guangzhouensis TaxID=2666084 RepID=A0A6I2LEI8_9BURK|nr:cupin-like domain-containing protein [Duganella guangzhouensis]MRW94669.1 cupin-like domain-containing protein [Duganella guangzhouensis]
MSRDETAPAVAVNDSWRGWIAENLVLGAQPETLAGIMVESGIAAPEAEAEVAAAVRSPYLSGVARLSNRLAKRDWVLGIQARLNRLTPPTVPRRACLSGDEFLDQYYRRNQPVIITGMLDDCAAREKWSFDYLATQLGQREVEVQFGRNADADYELNSASHRRRMPFADYVALVRAAGVTNDFYMTANNDHHNREALRELMADLPPLDQYLKPGANGFFWFGPAGTITPFHHDLTNNFMIQVAGRKRVRMVAPCDTPNMYNQRHCFSPVDGRGIDLQRFPLMAEVPVLECVLAPGEILFLPVGWWHFVEALDVTITISTTQFRWDNDFYTHYPRNQDF